MGMRSGYQVAVEEILNGKGIYHSADEKQIVGHNGAIYAVPKRRTKSYQNSTPRSGE